MSRAPLSTTRLPLGHDLRPAYSRGGSTHFGPAPPPPQLKIGFAGLRFEIEAPSLRCKLSGSAF